MSLKVFLLILLAEVLGSLMHLFFKKGVNSLSFHGEHRFNHDTRFFRNLFKTPWIWAGIVSVMLGLSIWLVVLAQVDLSVAYPFDSLQYIIIFMASFFIFKEYLDARKLLGSGLIILGIWMVTFFGR
ncbi:MAG: EamA family transporter [Candidatus Omnitrophica bacterium]|nr:EamA family transporter [Candidatus Omnitrophota bacterium]